MGKLGYRLLVWAGLLLALLFGLHFVWLSSAKGGYLAKVEALRKAGEPVTPADLAEPAVPASQNAAPLLLRAYELYERNAEQPLCLYDPPEDWDEAQKAEVAAYLERCKPFFDLLKQAAAKPKCRFDHDWEQGAAVVIDSIPLMLSARRALEHRARQKPETALESIALLLDLSQKMEPQSAITELVRQDMVSVALDTLKQASRRPGIDARRARAVLETRFLASLRPGLLVEVLRCERAFALWYIDRMIRGEGDWCGGEGYGFMGWAPAWLRSPVTYRDGSRCLDLLEEAIGLAQRKESFQAFERRVQELGESYLISRGFAQLPGRLQLNTIRHESRVRVATRGLAALEHRQATGSWPANLDRAETDGAEGGVRIADGDVTWLLEPS